jgi:hypothetical protein
MTNTLPKGYMSRGVFCYFKLLFYVTSGSGLLFWQQQGHYSVCFAIKDITLTSISYLDRGVYRYQRTSSDAITHYRWIKVTNALFPLAHIFVCALAVLRAVV